MAVLMGFTLAGEVLQSANEMHDTSQTAQLRSTLAGRESWGSLLPGTIILSHLP